MNTISLIKVRFLAILSVMLLIATGIGVAEITDWQEKTSFRPWRIGATGPSQFKVGTNRPQSLSCLGTTLELLPGQWPKLTRRSIPWQSTERSRRKDQTLTWNLGQIAIGKSNPEDFSINRTDWSGAKTSWVSKDGRKLQIWMSRSTPVVLLESDAETISLFAGKESPKPKFFACEIDGEVVVRPAEEAGQLAGKLKAGGWLLVWFGKALESSRFSVYMPLPYPADCPVLVFFGNAPKSIMLEGSLRADFGEENQVGRVAIVPPFGDNYPLAELDPKLLTQTYVFSSNTRYSGKLRRYSIPEDWCTDSWSEKLPELVAEQCLWWAEHLHEVPVSARETYAYNADSETVTVTEKFEFVRLTQGGTVFAPIPPMLALAKEEGFEVKFSGEVVGTKVVTAHGPISGIENVREYTWTVSGLSRYVKPAVPKSDNTEAPRELAEELHEEIKKVIEAGILAPWYPVLDDFGAGYKGFYDRGYRCHFLWGNPAETIYYLAEVYPVLNPQAQEQVADYLKNLRKEYPPEEKLQLMKLGEGAARERYRRAPDHTLKRQNIFFPEGNFYMQHRVIPDKNLYLLARYYELPGVDGPSEQQWQQMLKILSPYLESQDWGTMGFFRRPVSWYKRVGLGGVIDINNWFCSLAGGIRLARKVGDEKNEQMLRGLFAKAAALRFAMGKYGSYLYRNGLLRSAAEPDWMMGLLAGSWRGHLYTTDWSGPCDEVAQVWQMDQFGCYIHESRTPLGYPAAPGILTFLDPVPELGRFFHDHLRAESEALMRRVEEAMPSWWTVYCPAVQTTETNIQPPDDAYQLFMLKAWVLGEEPEKLAWLRDVPWLEKGDLFYIHKLAETIKAYKKIE